ncbi:protein kinase [Dorcoceras hygrometricum]|uniref:Protein kinase n=1 Tax=Dorcoceras hygrometricum TaxID=472368 RepID=A0A2Z7AHH8_9LAMI|nr:protein kinase [Dorcoceras hygrometricum]
MKSDFSSRSDDVSIAYLCSGDDASVAAREIYLILVRSVSSFDDVSISWLLSMDDVSIAGLSLLGEKLLVDLMTSAACVVVVWLTMCIHGFASHSSFIAIVASSCSVFLPGSEGERQYRTLISLLGNPGSTAGRGFNPAGGAPGGG